MIGYMSSEEERRYRAKVKDGHEDACWPYSGTPDDKGRGYFWLNPKSVLAHRVMWILSYGPIPEGQDVLHTCHNPICCNPKHLKLGTRSDAGKKRYSNPNWTPPIRQEKRTDKNLLPDDIKVFWTKAPPENERGCQEWAGRRTSEGYGELTLSPYGSILAHRASWIIENGPIPDGLFVLHKCDNPPCVNPNHLFLGTNRQNIEDRHAKKRDASGDRNGSRLHPERVPKGETHPKRTNGVKITYDQADYVRSMKGIKTCYVLAEELGITFQMVSMIWCGKSWPERSP